MNIINCGHPGYNSVQLFEILEEQIISVSPDMVCLMAGTNDCLNSHNSIELWEYKQNICNIIDRLSKKDITVVLLTIIPCIENELLQRHSSCFYSPNTPNEKIELYNNALLEIAADKNVLISDVHKAFVSDDCFEVNLLRNKDNSGESDGVHPTPEGYELIASVVVDTINHMKDSLSQIICYGNSITYGVHVQNAGSSDGQTYPAMLKKYLEE